MPQRARASAEPSLARHRTDRPSQGRHGPTTVDDVVANVGDVDGDGYEDFATGRPFFSAQGSGIVIMSGRDHKFIYGRGHGSIQAGASIAGADINGDGFSDVLYGAPGFTTGNVRHGQIWWYSGKEKVRRIFVNGKSNGLGTQLATAMLDAEGTPDVVSVNTFERDLVISWPSPARTRAAHCGASDHSRTRPSRFAQSRTSATSTATDPRTS